MAYVAQVGMDHGCGRLGSDGNSHPHWKLVCLERVRHGERRIALSELQVGHAATDTCLEVLDTARRSKSMEREVGVLTRLPPAGSWSYPLAAGATVCPLHAHRARLVAADAVARCVHGRCMYQYTRDAARTQ